MAKDIKSVVDTWKKKRWHPIVAPKLFSERVIGESPALEPAMMIGRTVKSNLTNLTGDIKKQHVEVTFEVDKVMGDTAYTYIRSFEINPSAMKRFVRRGKKRVDDSFKCRTSDSKTVVIKPFLVTKAMTTNSIITKLRKTAREVLTRGISGSTYDQICNDFVLYNLQKSMKAVLNKIYPLKICEIRMMSLIKGAGKQAEEVIVTQSITEEVKAPEAAPAESGAKSGKEEKAEEAKAEKEEKEEKKEKKAPKKEEKESKEEKPKKQKKKEE